MAVRWISNSDYSQIFQKLLIGSPDPQVILVGGSVTSGGSISLRPTYFIQNGSASRFDPTDEVMVEATDSAGNTVARASAFTSFNLLADSGQIIPVNSSPFVIQLPFLPTMDTIKVSYKGQIGATFNVNSQLLVDVIRAIPDQGFAKNPTQMRKALLNKADAFSKIVAIGSYRPATNKLQNDIRKSVEDWVVDNYPVSSPLQLTKVQVLAVIDTIIAHLESRTTYERPKDLHCREIQHLMPKDHPVAKKVFLFQKDTWNQPLKYWSNGKNYSIKTSHGYSLTPDSPSRNNYHWTNSKPPPPHQTPGTIK